MGSKRSSTELSIVIPTCGREALRRCLETFLASAPDPRVFEVIVSDDSPDERGRAIVEKTFPKARWVAGPRRGPAANRNHGARQARGEWLLFVDDDCEPSTTWFRAVKRATAEAVDVIEGRTVCPDPSDSPFCEKVENLDGGAFWSCNLAIRRSVFERLGGFDEDFTEAGGEDMELAWRLRWNQVPTTFVPEALVYHPSRRIGWRKLWWRTFLMRWMLLYRIKTGQAPKVGAHPVVVLVWLLRQQCTDLARTSLHLFTRGDRSRRRLFLQFWKWLTFPILLPYLLVWEFRFRRLLAERLLQ